VRYGVLTRSQPATSAPQARVTTASALIPAPPIPANQSFLPASGRKRDQLLRDHVGRVRTRGRSHGLGHPGEPGVVREQPLDDPRNAGKLGLLDDDRAPGLLAAVACG
jgi:hypothetical protein